MSVFSWNLVYFE